VTCVLSLALVDPVNSQGEVGGVVSLPLRSQSAASISSLITRDYSDLALLISYLLRNREARARFLIDE
jgi:hypothetical protein